MKEYMFSIRGAGWFILMLIISLSMLIGGVTSHILFLFLDGAL